MIVLVCGGRHYDNWEKIWEVLDKAARGADSLAGEYAGVRGIDCVPVPAVWRDDRGVLDRSAGARRNTKMLDDHHPDLVIGFSGGAGTANMLKQARSRGYAVIQIIDDIEFVYDYRSIPRKLL